MSMAGRVAVFQDLCPYINCRVTEMDREMDQKDAKTLLSGILNDDKGAVKRIVTSYIESAMGRELDRASTAIMESIGNGGKSV